MRPDKQKVVDEVWDDARVESFLHKPPMGDEDAEFSVLLNAYRAMRPDDFARFIRLYTAAGRDLGARSRSGKTLRETLAAHRHAEPFRQIIAAAGG
ncbi:MAG: PA4642 family protein [Pseudomonadales bacterium]